MANYEILNNIDHKDLKIDTKRCKEYGDDVWFTMTFPDEFRAAQAYYPIFFQKNAESGQFFPVALFGFTQNENLFLDEDGWDAGYIPASIARIPFAINRIVNTDNGVEEEQRVLSIDMDNARVNKENGLNVFEEFGGNSDYLESIADMMEAIHQGISQNQEFINCLTELNLLEPFTLDVELNDQSKYQMVGFYTINETVLSQLSDSQITELNKAGYLQAIHFQLASQGNIGNLLARKNKLLGLKRR